MITPRLLLCLALMPLCLTARVEVQRVTFEQSRSGWIAMLVDLRSVRDDNPAGYDENVKVVPHLSYQIGESEFMFLRSSAEVLYIKNNQTVTVPFLVPASLVERYRLRPDPFAFYVEVTVAGTPIEFKTTLVSRSIQGNAEAIRSLKARCEGPDGKRNDGVLRPYYLDPAGLEGVRVQNLPIFRRPEAFPID